MSLYCICHCRHRVCVRVICLWLPEEADIEQYCHPSDCHCLCFGHITYWWDSLILAPTSIGGRVVGGRMGDSPFQQDDLTSCLQLGMKSFHSQSVPFTHAQVQAHADAHTWPTRLQTGCWGDSWANEAILRWDHCRTLKFLFPLQNCRMSGWRLASFGLGYIIVPHPQQRK